MFKWPGTPSAHAPEHELADFAELVCWQHRSMSTTALCADLGRLEENDYSAGVPEEDKVTEVVEEAYLEIERRVTACRGGYPYALDERGYTLTMAVDDGNYRHVVYQYLLLATRLNMSSNRMHAGIDGSLLLEELAADAAREYLGDRPESLVFGTSAGLSDFREKATVFVNGFGKVRAFSIATGLNPRNVTANWTWSYGSPSPMVIRESSSRLASARREPTIRTR